jgi:hypothetical protein
LLSDTDEFKIELKMIEPFKTEDENEWIALDNPIIKNLIDNSKENIL